MEFGIFNLMGAREPEKTAAQVFAEVAEQTRLADELGYSIAWFAEHHFSNYCLCASPLMMVAHCASITQKIRLGTAVVVLPLYNPARLAAEVATADALSNGRLMLGIGAGYQPYEFDRFGVDLKQNLEMTEEAGRMQRYLVALAENERLRPFLLGVAAAVVGLIAAVTVQIVKTSVVDVYTAAMAIASFGILLRFHAKLTVLYVVLGCGAIGALLQVTGAVVAGVTVYLLAARAMRVRELDVLTRVVPRSRRSR